MITVEREVNVSKKRLDIIQSMASVISKDLDITDMTVNICPASELNALYGADGLCGGTRSVDIVNKRDVEYLFKVIAHEIRHSYQHITRMTDDLEMMELDAEAYEQVAFDKLYKSLDIH